MSTIAAIATGRSQGAIGIVRISGPDSLKILRKIFTSHSVNFKDFKPYVLHRGTVTDIEGIKIDDVLAVYMPGPKTYTGEDVAEIHCHGNLLIVNAVLEHVLQIGARQAEKGEFTKRAFLNGRIDLSQAEAVAELINAPGTEALRYSFNRLNGKLGELTRSLRAKIDDLRMLACVSVDFPEDEVPAVNQEEFAEKIENILAEIELLVKKAKRARLMQSGSLVVLAGMVNAGKSSLLNALSGRQRSLVTPLPGTTRDFIEVQLDFDGTPVTLVDTAGFRDNAQCDPIEALGIDKSKQLLADADLIVLVLDGQICDCQIEPDSLQKEIMVLAESKPVLLIWNKCDLCEPVNFPPKWAKNMHACALSSKTGENIETLIGLIRSLLGGEKNDMDDGLAPNTRQCLVLQNAANELAALLDDIKSGQTYDCCISHLDTAGAYLEDVTGLTPHSGLLDKIFSQFCIGK